MSVVNAIAAGVIEALQTVPGIQGVERFGGTPTPDAVKQVGLLLPGALVITTDSQGSRERPTVDLRRRTIGVAVLLFAAPKPGTGSKYANPSVQVWELEEPIVKLINGNDWGVPGVVKAQHPESSQIFSKSLGVGHALLKIEWEQDYDLPAEIDFAALQDLTDVVVDSDFAHVAPDGSTPPDGVVDHSVHVEDLDT